MIHEQLKGPWDLYGVNHLYGSVSGCGGAAAAAAVWVALSRGSDAFASRQRQSLLNQEPGVPWVDNLAAIQYNYIGLAAS